MYILHNWKIIFRAGSSGDESICLGGKVYGNARFASGEPITTSAIAWYRVEADSVIVATRSGSEYMLGKPNTSEPFAKRRLIRHLEERGRLEKQPDDDIHTRRMIHLELLDKEIDAALPQGQPPLSTRTNITARIAVNE